MDSGFPRYERQVILPEIGPAGQERLARSRVLVIGAGALGTAALYYLAAAGIGTLGIADDDTLELSNLHRQILYTNEDIGRKKAEAAAERLKAFNPDISAVAHPVRVTADNAVNLMTDYELVVDATDRLETKFLINDACAKAARPLVHAAVLGFEARVAVFDAGTGPCLRCLFPSPPEVPALTCSEAGVLGAITGITGSLQALEAIKWLLKESNNGLETLLGRLWLLDGRSLQTRVVDLPRDPQCRICSKAPDDVTLSSAAQPIEEITHEQIDRYPNALLVDVREDYEWESGHLPGAVHHPLSGLLEALPELPESKHYVFYCAHGQRSLFAAKLFRDAGYHSVFSLAGGITACPDKAVIP
ncbi:MAG TPA: HesA/MoeB/ThiF family protein [Gammaproteobacteria bacterium]|nr:HesA/MoeB/ThiF family protein [Gammaproteobacteria bacterium]